MRLLTDDKISTLIEKRTDANEGYAGSKIKGASEVESELEFYFGATVVAVLNYIRRSNWRWPASSEPPQDRLSLLLAGMG